MTPEQFQALNLVEGDYVTVRGIKRIAIPRQHAFDQDTYTEEPVECKIDMITPRWVYVILPGKSPFRYPAEYRQITAWQKVSPINQRRIGTSEYKALTRANFELIHENHDALVVSVVRVKSYGKTREIDEAKARSYVGRPRKDFFALPVTYETLVPRFPNSPSYVSGPGTPRMFENFWATPKIFDENYARGSFSSTALIFHVSFDEEIEISESALAAAAAYLGRPYSEWNLQTTTGNLQTS